MRLSRTTAALGLVLLAALPACTTTVRQHPQFEARLPVLRSAAVIPPEVQVVRVVFKGTNEPLHAEAEAVAGRLPELIAQELRGHGFVVKEAGLDDEAFQADPELRFETTQVKRAFGEASQEMYQTVPMTRSKALATEKSIGPQVNRFADHAGVDAVAFARLSAFTKSGGEIAKDVAMTVLIAAATLGGGIYTQPTRGAQLEVALVDGDTGDVLWANVVAWQGDFLGEGLEKMVRSVFEPLPKRPPE